MHNLSLLFTERILFPLERASCISLPSSLIIPIIDKIAYLINPVLKYKHMRKRVKYSQNFLKSKKLVRDLIKQSSINKEDLVYEIGAGQGIITKELADHCKKVIAFEIDKNLHQKLKEKFQKLSEKIVIKPGNFLKDPLSNQAYKVFSNIPFNITSDIIKKLIFSKHPPIDSYLILQKEAAKKFAGIPLDTKNSLISIFTKVMFEISIFHNFKRTDFFPQPKVKIVMLRIKKKASLLPKERIDSFYNFITYAFSQFEPNILKGLSRIIDGHRIKQLAKKGKFSISYKPSQLKMKSWLNLFNIFLKYSNKKQKNKIKNSFNNLQRQQGALQKIHRTRLGKNWKQCKN